MDHFAEEDEINAEAEAEENKTEVLLEMDLNLPLPGDYHLKVILFYLFILLQKSTLEPLSH